jgi:glucose uptake protein GlcU
LRDLPWQRWGDVWPGIVGGVVLNLSFTLSIYANGEISFAVAQPILQTALVVSGLWGICVFGEIKGRLRVGLFFSAAAVVLVGATVLALYGPAQGAAESACGSSADSPEPEPAEPTMPQQQQQQQQQQQGQQQQGQG